jgi:outer membrane receptor protein involved in Fe transport
MANKGCWVRISVVGIVLLISVGAAAQELGTAVLNGDVTDPQGAVVGNARVTARNTATDALRVTMSSHAGLFVFNDLIPGQYEVRVDAQGFAPSDASVRLQVGQQAKLKFSLSIEKQQTTIDINDTENAPPVNTVSSVVDGVVTAHQIDNLPLNGRNFLELALLMPGNTMAPNFDPTKTKTVVISSAGQLGRGGNVTIDGSDNNDDAVGGMLLNLPQDAVEEFQIATNRFSAETGRSGSSVVNVVTKSGSNSVRGSASVYERDQVLEAQPPTFSAGGAPSATPPFRRQQYAGTIGGPLVKDKAWWFGGFEYRDELSGVLVGTRDVAAKTISRSFARAPLTDTLGTTRGDWQISDKDHLSLHYSIERQEATDASTLNTSLGSASQRQNGQNNFQGFISSWTRVLSPTLLNKLSFSVNNFFNHTVPVSPSPQLDFPSLTDGASFRVPQQTTQNRLQWDDGVAWTHGRHNLHFGGQFQRLDDEFDLGVFQQGRIELIEDFPAFDRNGDGVVNDEDLLFAVTIRSDTPARALILPNSDNNHIAGYIQDDWRAHPQLTLNLGLRYEIDTDVNNLGRYNQVNPILAPFLKGNRHKDANNFGPRAGFNWANKAGRFSLHGGYGIYYDRITLEIESLERGLDGRALAIDVRQGNLFSLDGPPRTGHFLPGAPTLSNAFTGNLIPGAGAAAGIDVIDNNIQNPMVQQFNLGVQWEPVRNWVVKVDGIHNLGTHFIIGVPLGAVINPVVGGPEGVTSLKSAVNTHYDALWLTVDRRFRQRYQFHSAYTFSKALNYANDDQIPFAYPPVDPNDLHREYGPTPNDQRHRLVLQGTADLPFRLRLSSIWTYASGVPMDILLGDGSAARVPQFGRNSGGREFRNGAELNAALTQLNAAAAAAGSSTVLPLVDPNARFNDNFNSCDLRLSKDMRLREGMNLQVLGEVFNLFNVSNILGFSTTNYSGYFNALVPDQGNPNHSSAFGKPVTTAGGIFGSGGPRAFQLAAKLTF